MVGRVKGWKVGGLEGWKLGCHWRRCTMLSGCYKRPAFAKATAGVAGMERIAHRREHCLKLGGQKRQGSSLFRY